MTPRRTDMNSLTIQDLPVTEQLDRAAMSAVRGGVALLPGLDLSQYNLSTFNLSLSAPQFIGQTQNVFNQNSVGSAGRFQSNVNPVQLAANSNTNTIVAIPG
jgi:hypothetical protein